jgi:hypothetical protein
LLNLYRTDDCLARLLLSQATSKLGAALLFRQVSAGLAANGEVGHVPRSARAKYPTAMEEPDD